MNRLVMHHIYANGMAFDLSGYRNHGLPYDVFQAPAPYSPSFAYTEPDSRVVVNPSASLQDLIAVRAVVTFDLDPAGGITRRYNLIEGHLCFALYVNADGSLSGTILDSAGQWRRPERAQPRLHWELAPSRDPPRRGQPVPDPARRRSCRDLLERPGPVGSVGPNGIAIGHWPEPSGQYTFAGNIRESWVYKYDPAEAAKGLLDNCCCERNAALDEAAQKLGTAGYTAEQARAQGMEILKLGLSLCATVRGSDPDRSKQQATLSAMALAAFQRGDSSAYTSALTELAEMSATTLTAAQQQQFREAEAQLVKALPMPIKDWQALIAKLCLGDAKLNRNALWEAVSKSLGQDCTK